MTEHGICWRIYRAIWSIDVAQWWTRAKTLAAGRWWLSVFLAAWWLAAAAPAFASLAADQYNRGNQLYAAQKWAEALAAYQAALDAGADDADVYLNFGNAAYRANSIGLAIWAYEMGLRLAPRDADLRYNLRFAAAFQRDELPPPDDVFVVRVGRALAHWFTAGEALVGATVGWLALGLGVLLWGPLRRRRGLVVTLAALGLAILLFFGPLAAWRVHDQLGRDKAVVVADQAVVRTAPAPQAKEAFTVHGGMRLEVMELRDQYSRVRIPTGLEGWIDRAAYRDIRP